MILSPSLLSIVVLPSTDHPKHATAFVACLGLGGFRRCSDGTYAQETNRLNRERRALNEADRRELDRIDRAVAGILAAIEDGMYQPVMKARMEEWNGGSRRSPSAWRDNVFVERLWKSVKYEEVYLHAYDSVGEARTSISRYLGFYNGRRPHSSLDRRTPDQAYFSQLSQILAA